MIQGVLLFAQLPTVLVSCMQVMMATVYVTWENVLQANCGSSSCVIKEVAAQRQAGLSNPVVEAVAGFGSPDGSTTSSAPPGMALLSLHQAPYAVYPDTAPTGVDVKPCCAISCRF